MKKTHLDNLKIKNDTKTTKNNADFSIKLSQFCRTKDNYINASLSANNNEMIIIKTASIIDYEGKFI